MRGGLRANSGRPGLLTALQRLAIGIECEAEFDAVAMRNQAAAVERIIAQSDYRAVIGNLDYIPVSKRAAWLRSESCDAHRADVEEECHAIAGTSPSEGGPASRNISVPLRRPQGVRRAIIAAIATQWTEKMGKNVSRSTVTRCWEEARSMLKRMADEEAREPPL